MAKKDAVSKRLALEIALARRIKKAREETPKKVPEETPLSGTDQSSKHSKRFISIPATYRSGVNC
jgi:hypothetical protein